MSKKNSKTPQDKDKNVEPLAEDDSLLAKVIGFGLILLGVVFIVLAVVVFVLSRREPTLDDEVAVPEISAPEVVNEEEFTVSGNAEAEKTIIFWVDGDEYETDESVESDEDGDFEVTINVDGEGEYDVEAAQVEGFPIRKRSEMSDPVTVEVDLSAPSTEDASAEYTVEEDGTVSVSGQAEPGSTVEVQGEDGNYSAVVDEDGNYTVSGIEAGENVTEWDVVVEDEAGNEATIASNLEVVLDPSQVDEEQSEDEGENDDEAASGGEDNSGDLNGPGVSDSVGGKELPEASGELDAALSLVRGRNAIAMIAVVGLAVFAINSGIVLRKLRN